MEDGYREVVRRRGRARRRVALVTAGVVALSEDGRLLGGTMVDAETENTNAVMWRCG